MKHRVDTHVTHDGAAKQRWRNSSSSSSSITAVVQSLKAHSSRTKDAVLAWLPATHCLIPG